MSALFTDPSGPRTQIFLASTLYGVASLAAAIDQGEFDLDGTDAAPAVRRILVISNNAAVPETSVPPQRAAGFAALAARFDAVIDYNDTIYPHHPASWHPRTMDLAAWERLWRQAWGVGSGPVRLVVETLHVDPARAVCQVFGDAAIDVYADGLMSYGPTRTEVPEMIGSRVERLLYLDLVPDVEPVLLTEWAARPVVIEAAAFRAVLAGVADATTAFDFATLDGPVVLLLGQYLAALNLLSPAEESDLHVRMLRAAAASGARRIVFKPHPTAGDFGAAALHGEAARLGVELVILAEPMLAEVLFERLHVELVIGCFSTALMTAVRYYGLPSRRVGTGLMLERLQPYQNSNRIPVTLVDAVLPDAAQPSGPTRLPVSDAGGLGDLVRTVSYCMQSGRYPELRASAEQYLDAHYADQTRYFKRKRLRALRLPGPAPIERSERSAVRSVLGRTARRARRRLRRLRRQYVAARQTA